ncbi:sporulation protein YhbH [Geobacillus stearothermophilus]|uniref:sporulation protein YhbH n=1 Tax=Geobacillus stearothermophilus TaxID=1422 RepID=UPI0006ABFD57|nr:sporulation protein YhbH [Geobacillus stearothermophilus]KOR93146.1 stress response protein [Geobacillus stearothermophilus ATCC 12980]MED4879536.1 sporulation protein YhbH [Geobacillus stearothermophilus]MED5010157.1 sporulation protein YhbH [Geobacillus stearothermophilus]MED5014293.1 sporulation protein YhbH [Geobacillus stearothermophilus]MED5043731.1 sporulation protein YhbH [Geobacillus stearothermophilus]
MKGNFVVSKEDWSLHRKGYDDQKRHQEKVKEAIKNNLPDLITEESIIMSNGRDVIKIPIRSLDECKIRYNYEKNKHVGQGNGDSQVGDVVARDGSGEGQGPGKGQGAGDLPGQDYYEAEVSLMEIEEALFSQLELPNLQRKELDQNVVQHIEFNDIRRTGLMGNIDKKRTMLAAFKRNAMSGKPGFYPIYREDLKFKTWNEVVKPESKAVVLAMMDTSGSMGMWEKYMARSFFFWMTRFLRTKYETVDIAFIAHHTEAKVVSEDEFFTKGESGGTICSSAYRKALELIETKYSPSRYNIYPFHFSDGDNLTSDNARCVKLVQELMKVSNMFGYGEVNQYNRHSTLMSAYRNIKDEKFRYYILKQKSDVFHAMKTFFRKEENKAFV